MKNKPTDALVPDPDRIKLALQLFSNTDKHNESMLVTAFDCLYAEFSTRSLSLSRQSSQLEEHSLYQLKRLFRYATNRLSDVFSRHRMVNWLHEQSADMPSEHSTPWSTYGELIIKDFHVDLGSLMDAIAPVLLQANRQHDATNESRLPGFADIQNNGSPRSSKFRSQLQKSTIECIDSTNSWWPHVKKIRDMLTHREHIKIAFESKTDAILFQVYKPNHSPVISDPNFLWPQGKNVADFNSYSACVIAELLVFLELLGGELSLALGIEKGRIDKSMRMGDFSKLLKPMHVLANLEN